MAESIKKFIIKDAHGGTKESGSFSVVGEVHVNIVPGYGEPYADSEYVNGILTITIHNIEGNGITEITTDSQEGDEAVNTVTIKTNANPEGVTLEVRNGGPGPVGPQGPQGIPGEGAIWTGEGEEIMTLEQETGQAINKAMSQKAVSDILGCHLMDGTYTFEEIPSSTTSIFKTYDLNLKSGDRIKMSVSGLGTVISQWRYTFNDDSSTKVDTSEEEVEVAINMNVTRLNIQILAAKVLATGDVGFSLDLLGAFAEKEDVEELQNRIDNIEGEVTGIDTLNEYHESISKELNMQKIVPELTFRSGQLSFKGFVQADSGIQYTAPIEVKRNDIVYVKAYGPTQYTMMVAWVVNDGYVYDMIARYTGSNQWKELTFRAGRDGYISVCRKGTTEAIVEITRGFDEGLDAVLPNMLGVPQGLLKTNNGNLFDAANAVNNYTITNGSDSVSLSSTYWTTGFIELPSNVDYIWVNVNPSRGNLYDAHGTVIKQLDPRSPIPIYIATYPNAKYIRMTFLKDTISWEERNRLVISDYQHDTAQKPYSSLNPEFIGIKDKGLFCMSDLEKFSAGKVFGTYSNETTFIVDGESVEFDSKKVYIDTSSRILYRYNGTALTKAAVWHDRGMVFTESFAFSIQKSAHKENMIITATAKYIGANAPTIQMAAMPNAGLVSLRYTMKYIIGAKDNYSTKEWRPYNLLFFQSRTYVKVTIPEGTTLLVDDFSNYYSNQKGIDTYPMFHYRSGNGLNQGLTAWEEAAKLGYEYIIVIPKRTADGKWVIYHDDADINAMYYENGTAVTGSQPIGNYTYAELMELDIAPGIGYGGNKIPLLEDFFALCAKRGIHPCFSVHPNFTSEEWAEVRALSDKWGVTKNLNLKSGYITGGNALLTTCYSVFGDDVESYYVDVNTDRSGISEVQSAISTYNIDTSKVRVGIEYFHAYATDANINAARAAGIPVSVVTNAPNAQGEGGDTAEDILRWISMGVSGFTDTLNPSVGLNW